MHTAKAPMLNRAICLRRTAMMAPVTVMKAPSTSEAKAKTTLQNDSRSIVPMSSAKVPMRNVPMLDAYWGNSPL